MKFSEELKTEIPEDWEIIRIGEITEEFVGGGTPNTQKEEYWDGDIPWVTSATITTRFISTGQEKITKAGVENSATHIVPADNLIVGTRVGIGKTAINTVDIAISQDLTGIILNKKRATSEFVYWWLTNNKNKLKSMAQGSTIKGILKENLENLYLPLPPLPEQLKIAEILSSVDSAIDKADEAIEKTERLKKGLMNKLLTHGIGHENFKNTELGMTPTDWEVKMLDQTAIEIIDGDRGVNYPKQEEFKTEGFCLFLNTKNIPGTGFNLNQCAFVPKERDLMLRKGKLKRGDIVLTTRGTVGNVALYDETIKFENIRINSGMVLLRNQGTEINTKFLYLLLRSQIIQKQILNFHSGSAQPQLPIREMKKILFVIPPLPEQLKIAEILGSVDQKLETQRDRKAKLERIKKRLMNDLLTGKKRVNT
ncbi:MAG: restriction endonuclease subunit S [Candidatus Bilamarchaeaceae archaeon]